MFNFTQPRRQTKTLLDHTGLYRGKVWPLIPLVIREQFIYEVIKNGKKNVPLGKEYAKNVADF